MTARKIARLLMVAGLVALAAPAFAAEAAKEPAKESKEKEPFGRLTVDEVEKLIKAKSIAVFDNNSKERYEKGHVPTATWVSIADFDAKVLPADKDAKLVFYCGNEKCMACHAGAKKALEAGYKNVFIMPAGIAGWEKANKPVETTSRKS